MSPITQPTVSAALADGGELGGPFSGHPSARGQSLIVEEFIARVLHRAHYTAQACDAPDAARTVLSVAHLFADELAGMSWRFDRVQFIQAVTQEPGEVRTWHE